MPDIRIEYPSRGTTYCRNVYGVYEYDEYPRSSVLHGRTRRTFLDSFDTLDEAKRAYPQAHIVTGSGFVRDDMLDLSDEET